MIATASTSMSGICALRYSTTRARGPGTKSATIIKRRRFAALFVDMERCVGHAVRYLSPRGEW